MGTDGQEYAVILKSEIEENIGKWTNTLVGYVMDNKPFFILKLVLVGFRNQIVDLIFTPGIMVFL